MKTVICTSLCCTVIPALNFTKFLTVGRISHQPGSQLVSGSHTLLNSESGQVMTAAPHPGNSHLQVSLHHLTLLLATEPFTEYLPNDPPAQFALYQ